MKANKLKKIMGQSIFKNQLKFQKFNFKIFYCDMTKCGHKQQQVFKKVIYTKTTVRNKIIWQENFRNVLRVTESVKYFNGWQTDGGAQILHFSSKAIFKVASRVENTDSATRGDL